MRKIALFAVLAGIIAFVPVKSFALVDFGVYGAYSFSGSMDNPEKDAYTADIENAPSGFMYGFIGHYNTSIFPLLRIGLGLYSEYSKLSFDIKDVSVDPAVSGSTATVDPDVDSEVAYGKKVIGFDAYLQLDFPLMPLHPYVKFATALYEDLNGDLKKTDSEWFNTYSTGIGAAFTFFPMMQIFAEYRYIYTKVSVVYGDEVLDASKTTGNAVSIGARLFL